MVVSDYNEEQTGVVQIVKNNSEFSGDPALAPMTASQSYWTYNREDSSATFSTNHSSSDPRKFDHCLNRKKRSSTSCSEQTGSSPSPPDESAFTIYSYASRVEPRNTPLRLLVEEFLKTKEMEWFPQNAEPLEFQKWLKRYPKWRRAQLEIAKQKVEKMGISRRDALVKNFIKRETTEKYVDPRNISPRSDEFLVVMGPHVSALEKFAGECQYLVKGLGLKDRAKKMETIMGYGSYLEVDFKRFLVYVLVYINNKK